jgi:AcrR family transcriptional regulator
MGLRELKKERTRRSVQEMAMRLFKKQGYAETTVEQIAAAAEISPATFYRYFPDKEDVALSIDYSPFIEKVIAECPANESLAGIVNTHYRHLAIWFESDRDLFITRYRLLRSVPDLKARRGLQRQALLDFLADLIAPRVGTQADNHELRLVLAISVAAESETVNYWAERGGTQSLADLLEHAYRKILPALTIEDNGGQISITTRSGTNGVKGRRRNAS